MKCKRLGSIILLFLFIYFNALCSYSVSAWEINKISTVTKIIDGDSFNLTGDVGVRLADVSAPEWYLPGGNSATTILTNLIDGKTVYLDTDPVKNYGRWVSVVYIKHNITHYKNINKYLWDYGDPFYHDNHSNEFDPSTWTLYVRYAEDPPPPPLSSNKAPIAIISGPKTGKTGLSVHFIGSESYDPEEESLEYYWSFGDRSYSTQKNPYHIYYSAGNYLVSLTVTDNMGVNKTETASIQIISPNSNENNNPEPDPSPDPNPISDPELEPKPKQPSTGNITISIEDFNQEKIENTEIKSLSQPDNNTNLFGYTDSQGIICFYNVRTGYYAFTIIKQNYKTQNILILVSENQTTTQNIILQTIPNVNDNIYHTDTSGILIFIIPVIVLIIVFLKHIESIEELSGGPIKIETIIDTKIKSRRALTYTKHDENKSWNVGTWQHSESKHLWILSFEPMNEVPLKNSNVGAWIRRENPDFDISINDEGKVVVFIPKGEKYSHIIGQISWAFYTLLKEIDYL